MDSSCAPEIVKDANTSEKTKNLVLVSSSDQLDGEREVRRKC